MTKLVVEYGPDATQTAVESVEALDELLDRLEAEAAADVRPWWIYIYDNDDQGKLRSHLSLGLGEAFSFVDWWSEETQNGAHSQGDLDGGEVTAWLYSGAYSELDAGRGIPKDTAREAVRDYLRTGQQPTNVPWQ